MPSTLLVTGAAGHLGRRVVAHLLGSQNVPPERIIAATRDPAKVADIAARGVRVRRADFEDSASLASAFAGVDRMLLISTDAYDRPGRRLTQHLAAVEAARKAGVKHVVYTSMPKPDDSLLPFASDHLDTEQALVASGLGWTLLRNSWYQELLVMALPGVLATGKWFTSTGEGRVAHVSREDCARTAAAALASEDTANSRLDVCGPRPLALTEIAATASSVTGKPIEVVQVSDEQLKQGLLEAGVPEYLVPILVAFDTNTRAGKVNIVSDAVEKLTGKPPQTLRDFLVDQKAQLELSTLLAQMDFCTFMLARSGLGTKR